MSDAWRTRCGLCTIALAIFLAALDNTVVYVALPTIGRDLGLSLSGMQWVIAAYFLTFSVLLLPGGRIADRHGRRPTFLAGVALFTAASLLAGLAPTGTVLILARMVQGAGAAVSFPAAYALLVSDFDERDRIIGFGLITALGTGAVALGPAVGGLISQYWHWSWIFYINIPVGAAVLLLSTTLPSHRPAGETGGDLGGLVTSATALLGLTTALIQWHSWDSLLLVTVLAGSAGAAVAFLVIEMRSATPLVDLALFGQRILGGGVVVTVLLGLGLNGVYFFTSLILQRVLGLSPAMTGLVFLPLAVFLLVTLPVVPWLVERIGAHWIVGSGLMLAAAGLVVAASIEQGSWVPQLLVASATIGFGSALAGTALTIRVLGEVSPNRTGITSSVYHTAREMSGVLGIAVTGAIVTAEQRVALASGATASDALLRGYSAGILFAAAIVIISAVIGVLILYPQRQP